LAPLVKGLHHVAIVVASLDEARPVYELLLGPSAGEPEHVPEQKVNVLVLHAGSQRIELVEPAGEDSPVTNFLARRGGGLHHLAYEVDDLESALLQLRHQGVRLIDETPQPGAYGSRVAFLDPKAMGGVLVELVEEPRGRRA
jgi:methylmalonyl-CoA/ethylmalonyl-CoA epimerase